MDKGEAYRFPAHDDVVSMFFKQERKNLYRGRRKLWNALFTSTGCVLLFFDLVLGNSHIVQYRSVIPCAREANMATTSMYRASSDHKWWLFGHRTSFLPLVS